MTPAQAMEIIRRKCETPRRECETVRRKWRGYTGWPESIGAHALITHIGKINRGIDGEGFDQELVELMANLRNNAW